MVLVLGVGGWGGVGGGASCRYFRGVGRDRGKEGGWGGGGEGKGKGESERESFV